MSTPQIAFLSPLTSLNIRAHATQRLRQEPSARRNEGNNSTLVSANPPFTPFLRVERFSLRPCSLCPPGLDLQLVRRCGLRGGQASCEHAEGRAGNIGKPDLVAVHHRFGIAADFAANAELDVWPELQTSF